MQLTGQRGQRGRSGNAGNTGRLGRMERSTALDAPGLLPGRHASASSVLTPPPPAGFVMRDGFLIRSARSDAGGNAKLNLGAIPNAVDHARMNLGAAPARNVTPDDAQLPVRLGSVVGAGEVVDAATAAAIMAQRPRAGGLVLNRQGKRAFRLVSGDPGKCRVSREPLTLDEALQLAVAARRASKLGRLSSGARVCLSMSERAGLNLSVLPKVGRNPEYGTLPGNGDARWTAAKRWTLRIVGRAVTGRAVVAGWRALAAA